MFKLWHVEEFVLSCRDTGDNKSVICMLNHQGIVCFIVHLQKDVILEDCFTCFHCTFAERCAVSVVR